MRVLSLALCFSLRIWAALPNTLIWEVWPTSGSDTNGGAFAEGASGTNFSAQAAAQVAYTDMVLGAGGTTYTSVLNPVGATLPGNVFTITGGAGCTVGRYEVVSQATLIATIDRSAGTAASVCTANLGGALESLPALDAAEAPQNRAWVKATGIISRSSSLNFAGPAASGSNQFPFLAGYTTAHGDGGQVTIQATANGQTMLTITPTNNGLTVSNFILDCNGHTSTTGLLMNSAFMTAENILVENCSSPSSAFGIQFNQPRQICRQCRVTASTLIAIVFFNSDNLCIDCIADTNTTGPGFAMTNGGGTCIFCISAFNTVGGGTHGFQFSNQGSMLCINCTAYANSGDGLRTDPSPSAVMVQNFVAWGNTGFGINCSSCSAPQTGAYYNFNAYGGNTAGNLNFITAGANDVVLTVDPFVNAAALNFLPNATAGGGAAINGKGYPGILPAGGTGFITMGALQPAAGASGTPKAFPIVQ